MKLTVLNTGSKGNCYLMTSSIGETLIIECGVKFSTVKQALNFELDKVVGCVVTHEHQDHFKAVRDVLVAGIDCYTSQGTIDTLRFKHHRLKPIKAKSTYHLGNYKVIPFGVNHDANEPLGFLINHSECGNVVFITDSSFVSYKFPNLNQVILEANYSLQKIQDKVYNGAIMEFLHNRIIKSHMSIETACELLQANELKAVNNIVLTHLSDSNSDAKLFHKTVSELTGKKTHIAEKGLCIPFGLTPF